MSTYSINNEPVTGREFADTIICRISDEIEKLEDMGISMDRDIAKQSLLVIREYVDDCISNIDFEEERELCEDDQYGSYEDQITNYYNSTRL